MDVIDALDQMMMVENHQISQIDNMGHMANLSKYCGDKKMELGWEFSMKNQFDKESKIKADKFASQFVRKNNLKRI